MRLPSIEQLLLAGLASARRFPLVLSAAVVSALAASLIPGSRFDDELLGGIVYAASLGIPLFLAISLIGERMGASQAGVWIARLLAAAFLVGIYVARLSWYEPVEILRYVQLSVAAHLAVAVAPYLAVREWNGFWQYNRSIFLRFLLAGVFSAVLYVGLAVALLAIDNLLGVNVDEDTYFKLWCWIAFGFNTWFFTAGVPEDFGELERSDDYPRVLKVFSQYILSPLVSVYILILTLYLGRILVTRVWPSGWIGYLVSSVAAAGILSLLLLYPIEEREENRWVRQYARWFWIGLIPANIMLLLAIWKRIQQYAITEPRYFLVILSLWLAGISLFYAITRSRNIKVIPASLALLAIATFAGPWSAYSVSRGSQTGRLQTLLERNGMWVDGAVEPATGPIPVEDRREISAVLRYLMRTHGTSSIDGWFPAGRLAEVDTVASGSEPTERYEADGRAALIAAELGIEYVSTWTPGEGEGFSYFVQQEGPPLSIDGYQYVLRNRAAIVDTVDVLYTDYAFAYDEERLTVGMIQGDQEVLSVSLVPLIERAMEYGRLHSPPSQLPADLLTLSAGSDSVGFAVSVTSIAGYIEDPADSGTEEDAAGEADAAAEAPPYRITMLSADFFYRIP